MKPLLILARIIIVGLLWSVFFMESIRVIMLRNWHFDILNLDHWQIAWDLWSDSWVISEPKEWAFVLIIVSFIPLWFTGWIALSMISWGKTIWFVITLPWKLFKNFFYKPVKIITTNTGVTPIRKKRSYKEIRPRALHNTPTYSDNIEIEPHTPIKVPAVNPIINVSKTAASAQAAKFDHALFSFDDEDDIDFDIDSFDVAPAPKPQPRNERRQDRSERYDEEENRDTRRRNHRENERKAPRETQRETEKNERRRNERENKPSKEPANNAGKEEIVKERSAQQRQNNGSCAEVIKQKGYELISRVAVKNTIIDYVGVSANTICLCMLDREPGDWLADEERFNDEEPLWFSENSHRISPVRKIELAQRTISDRLKAANLEFNLEAFLIIQIGNIINAEDMFEIWDSMNINVTRIDRGTPKEIKLFARSLPDAGKAIAPGKLDKLLNLLRNLD